MARKPSEIIELTLHSGLYGANGHSYMCFAIADMYETDRITLEEADEASDMVRDLVHSIDPNCCSMVSALFCACIIDGSESSEYFDAYTFQLYCWFVFDLKRKGL